jgi:hypothetical protein
MFSIGSVKLYTNGSEGQHSLLRKLFNGAKVSRIEFVQSIISYWEAYYKQLQVNAIFSFFNLLLSHQNTCGLLQQD